MFRLSWKMNTVFIFVTLAAMAFAVSAPAQSPANSALPAWRSANRVFQPDVVPFGSMLVERLTPIILDQRMFKGGLHLLIFGDPSVPGFEELKMFFPNLYLGYKGRLNCFLVDTSTVQGQELSQAVFKTPRPNRVVLELYKSTPPKLQDPKAPRRDIAFKSSEEWFKASELEALRKRAPKVADQCERGEFTFETLKEWLELRIGHPFANPVLPSLDDEYLSQVLHSDMMHLVIFCAGRVLDDVSLTREQKLAHVSDLDELANMNEVDAAIPFVKADIHDKAYGEEFYTKLRQNGHVTDWDGKLVVMLFRGHTSDSKLTERWFTRKLEPGNAAAQVKAYIAECFSLRSLDSQPWVLHKPASPPAINVSALIPAATLTTTAPTTVAVNSVNPPAVTVKEVASNDKR